MPIAAHPTETADFYARDVDFDLDSKRVSDWSGNEFRSLFLNALSITFPVGERFFIASVAHYRKRITDPKVRAEVNAFVAQEALHTREHLAYNVALETIADVAKQERRISKIFDFVKKRLGPRIALEVTCGLEHFTAILAKEILEHEAHLRGADERYARLWTWHALEECEHKAVSFDVYQAVSSGKGSWARIVTMVPVTVILYAFLAMISVDLMKGRGHARSPLAWAKLVWAVFGRDGLMRRIMPAYVKYYSPSFHPNDIDDVSTRERTKRLVESWA
jgi:hypothetical protein